MPSLILGLLKKAGVSTEQPNADGMGRGAKRHVPAEGGITDLLEIPFALPPKPVRRT